MNKLKLIALRTLLVMVMLAELNSILRANLDPAMYQSVFPGATGFLFYLTELTSFAALVNCVMIWLWRRWAVWANVLIGAWSVALVRIVGGPGVNQLIILFTTLGILWLSLLLLDRFHPRSGDAVREPD